MRKAGRQCRSLSEVSLEFDDPKMRIEPVYLCENCKGIVLAAVVDYDYFKALAERV